MTKRLLAAALVLLAFIAGAITTQEKPVADQFGSDPITDLARNAHGQAVTPNRLNSLERRVRALERFGRVDGMVFRTKYDDEMAEASTNVVGPTDLGGPSVTVTIPQGGGLVEVYAEVDARGSGGTPDSTVALIGPGVNQGVMDWPVATYDTRSTAPDGTSDGQPSGLGGPIRFFRATPGEATYTLEYGNGGAAGAAFFKNRRLWVGVARAGT